MKKLIALAGMAASLLFAAASVQAQTIDLQYKSADGKHSFNLANANKLQYVGSSIRVTTSVGLDIDYADVSQAVYNAIVADPKFQALYVQVGATNLWLNPSRFGDGSCVANKTRVIWTGKATYALEDFSDLCAAANAALARSN